MSAIKETLTLHDNLAAVRFSSAAADETGETPGVAVVIPIGEKIGVDRTEPLVGRMQCIEWKHSAYGVFPEDLHERSDEPISNRRADEGKSRRLENPGIVAIHEARD